MIILETFLEFVGICAIGTVCFVVLVLLSTFAEEFRKDGNGEDDDV